MYEPTIYTLFMAMSVTARDLRVRAAEILHAVREGETVTVTYRGRPVAEIRPVHRSRAKAGSLDEIFGMWKDRTDMKDVRKWIRDLRTPRWLQFSSTRTS